MADEKRILLERLGAPDLRTVDGYKKTGGYQALEKALKMETTAIIDEVKASGLRGRGGAGFPTGMKWGFLPKDNQKPVYLCCNADESEPGTCKDRIIIEEDPQSLIEGMLITCFAIKSHQAFIYIRGEFHHQAEMLMLAVEDARRHGYIGKNILDSGFDCEIVVYRGGGAYICGEESSLLTSLEGNRGYPRNKPPFPAVSGLYESPTVINNVETLATVPVIINKGGEWYAKIGTEKSTGTRLLCLSGHLKTPGVYEVELGSMTVREFINDFGGGVPDGRKIKGVIPGGSSMQILKDDELDIPLSMEAVQEAGSSLGSGGMIVMDDTTDMVEMAYLTSHFYEHESCGQCTPCREGTRWYMQIIEGIMNGNGKKEDLDLILSIGKSEFTSICALWPAAVWPIRAMVQKFPEDFLAKMKDDTKSGTEAAA